MLASYMCGSVLFMVGCWMHGITSTAYVQWWGFLRQKGVDLVLN